MITLCPTEVKLKFFNLGNEIMQQDREWSPWFTTPWTMHRNVLFPQDSPHPSVLWGSSIYFLALAAGTWRLIFICYRLFA